MIHAKITCIECSEEFVPNRTTAIFCSSACKSHNFRRNQREKMDFAERIIANLTEPVNGKPVKVDLFA